MIRWNKNGKEKWNHDDAIECHVHYKEKEEYKEHFLYSPAKILCFTNPQDEVFHAIVECCEFKFKRNSVFTNTWEKAFIYDTAGEKKPYICHVNVESIIRHALMIPYTDDDIMYYEEIWDRELWASEFL